MTNGVVIVHPEWGIFVGISMGLAFWSAMDCVGQDCVPVMPDETEARAFIDTWTQQPTDAFLYHPVQAAKQWTTIEELDAAGLSEWIDAEWDDGCNTPNAIPAVNQEGAWVCDCGDIARAALGQEPTT